MAESPCNTCEHYSQDRNPLQCTHPKWALMRVEGASIYFPVVFNPDKITHCSGQSKIKVKSTKKIPVKPTRR